MTEDKKVKSTTNNLVSIVLVVLMLFIIICDFYDRLSLSSVNTRLSEAEQKISVCEQLQKGNIFEPISPMAGELKK